MESNKNEVNSNPIKTCKVCGNKETLMAYGALCCSPCKIFFRRLASTDLNKLECKFGETCDITTLSRNICKSCRFKKCLSVGMQKELIRAKRSKQTQKKNNNNRSFSPVVIHTLDLLENDRSLLTIDQWSVISNVTNYYDERSPILDVKKTMAQQLTYPVKMQYKMVHEYYISFILSGVFTCIDSLSKALPQFKTLSSNDQGILIQRNIRCIGGMNGIALVRETSLYSNPMYFNVAVEIYGSRMIDRVLIIAEKSQRNITLYKLFMPILLFSTCTNVLNSSSNIKNNEPSLFDNTDVFSNTLALFQIQNFYVEIAFKYMLFQYGFNQAVLIFSNIIKTCLNYNIWESDHDDLQYHDQVVDKVTKDLEQTFVLDDQNIE